MQSSKFGVALLAVACVLQPGCGGPDCPEGTRKIGITCVPLRLASDAGDAASVSASQAANAAGLKGVDAGLPGLDASSDRPADGGTINDGASTNRDDLRGLAPGAAAPDAGTSPVVDSAAAAPCFLDRDGDGSGSAADPVECLHDKVDGALVGAVTTAGDCDDMDPKRAPQLTDVCGDSIDNDCDGMVDDKSNNACGGPCQTALAHPPGQACDNALKGACARKGVYTCQGTDTTVCNAGPGSPSTETCDGLDNDCDGTVDNGFFNECGGACTAFLTHKPGQPCTNGQPGACNKAGTYQCQGEMTACDAPKMKPGRDCDGSKADGIDNDCDGTVDNVGHGAAAAFGDCVLLNPTQPTPL